MTRFYELTYLIPSDLSEEELQALSKKVSDFVVSEGGVVNRAVEPQKRRLGYPIKKKSEAYMMTLIITLAPDALAKVEKKIREENNVLRYVILSRKTIEKPLPKKIRRLPARIPTKEPIIKEHETTSTLPKTEEHKKIELKEIDQKIEEILNQ